MKMLAIIPARKGSKGIPDKNAATVGGKPLIQWTVECALAAPSVGRTLVTTDSPQLADLAVSLGAEAPFLRPPELARDDSPGIDPIIHAVNWLKEKESFSSEYIVVLQPTSPLRIPGDIEAALALAEEKSADAVISISYATQHPLWMKTLDNDGRIADYIPQRKMPFRRQDLPEVYSLNGAIYLGRTSRILDTRSWYTGKTYGLVMPAIRSLDVDTLWDLRLADILLKEFMGGEPGADR